MQKQVNKKQINCWQRQLRSLWSSACKGLVWTFCCRHSPLLGIQIIFLQIVQIYSKQCVLEIYTIYAKWKKFVVCYVWFRHSAAGTLHFYGYRWYVCKYFWLSRRKHNCFSFEPRKKSVVCNVCFELSELLKFAFFSHILQRLLASQRGECVRL